jgi:hypothetical protein
MWDAAMGQGVKEMCSQKKIICKLYSRMAGWLLICKEKEGDRAVRQMYVGMDSDSVVRWRNDCVVI